LSIADDLAAPQRLCPVCLAVCTHTQDHMDYALMEETVACPQCGYLYEFVTGNTTERIGQREWWWTWNETHEECLARRHEQAETLKEERERWKGK
jgi:nitrite reductase/ring-hydroxylating ferredoxin subunit